MLNYAPIIKSNTVNIVLYIEVIGGLELSYALKGSVV
jgi:hypothetical protein